MKIKSIYLLLIFLLPLFSLGQDLNPRLGYTLVNFSLVNEYDIPYPNARIKLINSKNEEYSLITDSLGQNSLLLKQENTFKIICIVGENIYEYDNQLIIKKEDALITLDVDLKLDFYEEIIELSNLYFPSGQYLIEEKYKNELKNIINFLITDITINIELAGHTDDIGDQISNQILSEKRVKSLKDFFVLNGIDKNRIVCVGYGELQPIVKNNDNKSRAKNRRIEIRILR